MVRNAIAAGRFYPGAPEVLRSEIEKMVDDVVSKEEVIGVVSPHAGYPYSGPVAGATLSRIRFKDIFVILGPNHTGRGVPFSIMTDGYWETPMGSVEIDSGLARKILENSDYLEEDEAAHAYEHSIEVQLPFLQYFNADVRIVPIVLAHASGNVYVEIGRSIAQTIKEARRNVVILASSDMSHYEAQDSTKTKDMKAIEAILALDEEELLKRVRDIGITMCGYGPTVSLLAAAKDMGAQKAELVRYQTSGDTTGDYDRVVGYAGVIIK